MIHTFCYRWICNWFSGLDSSAWFVPYLAKQVKKNVFLVIFLFQCLVSVIFGQLGSWGSGVGKQPSTRSHYSWSSVACCLTVSEGQRFPRGLQGLLIIPPFRVRRMRSQMTCVISIRPLENVRVQEGPEWWWRRAVYSHVQWWTVACPLASSAKWGIVAHAIMPALGRQRQSGGSWVLG